MRPHCGPCKLRFAVAEQFNLNSNRIPGSRIRSGYEFPPTFRPDCLMNLHTSPFWSAKSALWLQTVVYRTPSPVQPVLYSLSRIWSPDDFSNRISLVDFSFTISRLEILRPMISAAQRKRFSGLKNVFWTLIDAQVWPSNVAGTHTFGHDCF